MAESIAEELKRFVEFQVIAPKLLNPDEKSPFVYRNAFDFVLQHGTVTEIPIWSGEYRQGVMGHCFAQAMEVAVKHDLPYVEGYAVANTCCMPIHHAWNIDHDGNLLDVTWGKRGVAYMGVPFSAHRAIAATIGEKGWQATVLEDWQRGYPLLRERWTGEDPNAKWPRFVNGVVAVYKRRPSWRKEKA